MCWYTRYKLGETTGAEYVAATEGYPDSQNWEMHRNCQRKLCSFLMPLKRYFIIISTSMDIQKGLLNIVHIWKDKTFVCPKMGANHLFLTLYHVFEFLY